MASKPRAGSQVARVIRAARSYRGVTRVDFQLPDVIDGGNPIHNFPGRIQDAEVKYECVFEIIGKRHGCNIYRLIESERSASPAPTTPSPSPEADPQGSVPLSLDGRLFEPEHKPGNAIWDEAA